MKDVFEVRYLATAVADLEGIFDYILQDNPSAAASMLEKFDAAVSRLAGNPYLGVVPRDERLRRLSYHMLMIIAEYLVFYVVKPHMVQIRRILHGARDYRFLL